MTEIQKKLMQMVSEIDVICKKNDLHYVLADQTAARAGKNKRFTNSVYEFHIMMTIVDVEKLIKYVREQAIEDREFESWENNSSLPQMYFRYVDTQSLLIDGENGDYYAKPGVAITILALKVVKPSFILQGCERCLQLQNRWNKQFIWVKAITMKLLIKVVGKRNAEERLKIYIPEDYHGCIKGIFLGGIRILICGKNTVARMLVRKHSGVKELGNSYWLMGTDGRLISFPAEILLNVKNVTFENMKLPVTKNMNKYLKKIFGKNWKIDAYKSLPIENRFRVISDSELPYKEYIDFIENQQPTFKFIMGYRAYYNQWKEYKYSPVELKVTNTFKQAKMSVDRIDVWYRLKDRREDLKKSYKVQDISSLKIILKEYLQKTEKYKSDKIGFYIDDEIWNYAKLIWESEGKKNYAETLYSYIPDLYKTESVEDYLQAKGILESMKGT